MHAWAHSVRVHLLIEISRGNDSRLCPQLSSVEEELGITIVRTRCYLELD